MRYFILIVFCSLSISATASDANGKFHVHGGGTKYCTVFTQTLDKMVQLNEGDISSDMLVFSELFGWLQGFLSAANKFTEETYDITGGVSREEIVRWVVNYCLEHPNEYFGNAVEKFIIESYPGRSKIEPK